MAEAKKPKIYHFHSEWEDDYFFIYSNSKSICLICNASVALSKKGNLGAAFQNSAQTLRDEFSPNSALRSQKVRDLKGQLNAQQSIFTRPNNKSKAATIASYRVSHVLAKHMKSFKDGEVVKEAFLEAADALFGDSKNNSSISTGF